MANNDESSAAETHGSSPNIGGASSSKDEDSKKSSDEKNGRKLFLELLELCKSMDRSQDMETIAVRVSRIFDETSSDYINSSECCTLIENKLIIIQKDPKKLFLHLKEIRDELKANKKKSAKVDKKDSSKPLLKSSSTEHKKSDASEIKTENSESASKSNGKEEMLNSIGLSAVGSLPPSVPASTSHAEASSSKVCDTPASSSKPVVEELGESSKEPDKNSNDAHKKTDIESVKKDRLIMRLEIAIAKLHRKIKELEQKEVNFEDSDDEESAYVLKSRYEDRLCALYRKLCQYKKESVSSGHQLQAIKFSGTKHPDINRAVEKFFNRKREFPNFPDIMKVVTAVNVEKDLNFSSERIHGVAKDAFKELGDQLKRMRQYELHSSLTSYLSEAELTEMDPAKNNEELEKKLLENKKHYQQKMQEVINTFAEKQSEINVSAILEADAELIDKGVSSPSVSSRDGSDYEEDDEEIEEEVNNVLNEKEEGENEDNEDDEDDEENDEEGSEGDSESETESEARTKVGKEDTFVDENDANNDEGRNEIKSTALSSKKMEEEEKPNLDDKKGDPIPMDQSDQERIEGSDVELVEQENDVIMVSDDVETPEETGETRSEKRQNSCDSITVLSSEESKEVDDISSPIPMEEDIASAGNSLSNEDSKNSSITIGDVVSLESKSISVNNLKSAQKKSEEDTNLSEEESSKSKISNQKTYKESSASEKQNQITDEESSTSKKLSSKTDEKSNQEKEEESTTKNSIPKTKDDPKKSLCNSEDIRKGSAEEEKIVEANGNDAEDAQNCLVEKDSFASMKIRLNQINTGLKVVDPTSPIDVLTNPLLKIVEEDIYVASSSGSIYLSPEKKRTGVYISNGLRITNESPNSSKAINNSVTCTSKTSQETASSNSSCQKIVIFNPSETSKAETKNVDKSEGSTLTPSLITKKNSVFVVSDCGSTFVVPKKENETASHSSLKPSSSDKLLDNLNKFKHILKKLVVPLERCDDLVAKLERRRKKRLKLTEVVSVTDSSSNSASDDESTDSRRTWSSRRRRKRSSSSDSDFDPSKSLSLSSSRKKKKRNSSQNSSAVQLFQSPARRRLPCDSDDITVIDEVPARKKGSEEIVVEVDTSSLLGIYNPGPSKSNVPYNFQNYPKHRGNISITPVPRPPIQRPITNLVPKFAPRTAPVRFSGNSPTVINPRFRGMTRPFIQMRQSTNPLLVAGTSRFSSPSIRQTMNRFRHISPQPYQQAMARSKVLPRGGTVQQQSSFQTNSRQFNGANGKLVHQNQSVSTFQMQQTAPKQTTINLTNNRQNVQVVTKTVTQTVRTVVQQQRVSQQIISPVINRNATVNRINNPQRIQPKPPQRNVIKPLKPHADVITID